MEAQNLIVLVLNFLPQTPGSVVVHDKASNIDLQWSYSIIGKFEDGSSKISKIGRGIFQIFEYSKNSKKQMNDALVLLILSVSYKLIRAICS